MKSLFQRLLFPVAIASLAACGSSQPVSTPSGPHPTAIPLYELVTLTTASSKETNQTPPYTLTAAIPSLQGSDDPRVAQFNQQAAAIVQKEIGDFKVSMQDAPNPPITGGSFFDQSFELLSPPGNLLSLKFEFMIYMDGATHPGSHSQTVTYNLSTGTDINLDQLFLPGSNYLETISNYCKGELSKRDIGFDSFVGGADPTVENYRNWNVSADGLLITFDEYQVAAYAAGPQTVLVPYSELQSILDPQGPLGEYGG